MEFVIKNKIGRSHRNMTALRFILLTETLVRSVHETGDLTGATCSAELVSALIDSAVNS